jgi:signal peptidase I
MKKWLRDNRGLILFLLCFGAFRTAVADWNPVPTGSMRPTILEGDVVLVNRLAYDLKLPLTDIALARLGEPQRGDIVTFASPKDGSRLIKRLVGVPGDVIELRGGALFLNGERAAYSAVSLVDETPAPGLSVRAARATESVAGHRHIVQVYPRFGAAKNFGPVTVPPEHYFMLGDNRDNSEDSRFIGFVPRAALIGRAGHVIVSADILGHWLPRLERTASRLQ